MQATLENASNSIKRGLKTDRSVSLNAEAPQFIPPEVNTLQSKPTNDLSKTGMSAFKDDPVIQNLESGRGKANLSIKTNECSQVLQALSYCVRLPWKPRGNWNVMPKFSISAQFGSRSYLRRTSSMTNWILSNKTWFFLLFPVDVTSIYFGQKSFKGW